MDDQSQKNKNAQRQARWRERQKSEGKKVGAVVPAYVFDALRQEKTLVVEKPVLDLLSKEQECALKIGMKLQNLTGWRKKIAFMLINE